MKKPLVFGAAFAAALCGAFSVRGAALEGTSGVPSVEISESAETRAFTHNCATGKADASE